MPVSGHAEASPEPGLRPVLGVQPADLSPSFGARTVQPPRHRFLPLPRPQRECRTAWIATTRLMIATTTPATTITIARMVRPTVTRWGLVLEMACRRSADALMFPVVAAALPRNVAPDPAV